MLDAEVVPVAAADVEVEVDFDEVADVEVDVDDEDDSALESLKELWLINMEQNASPSDCIMQSYPNGQQLSEPHVDSALDRDVVKIADLGKAVIFCFWMSHEMVLMLLQSWSFSQHIAEDPSSIDIHWAS